ncbi:MAG: SOS response-associated peptidase [Planctomycetaceae bacterium]|nr:SOS response-associated peptidase [Planctomycetaceae bacterium]
MCGRYNLRANQRELSDLFGVYVPALSPRFNIAPTQQVLSIRLTEGSREAAMLRWGLVPIWSKDPKSGPPLINARGDTVREKPSFRSAFKARRCLVPASGFYEWQTIGAGKQPYHITMTDGLPFAIAGLWEHWHGGDKVIESCTLITTSANALMEPFHDRMPVIVAPDDFDTWLAGEPDAAATLLRPFDPDAMTAHPVSTIVNNARNESPECVKPIEG